MAVIAFPYDRTEQARQEENRRVGFKQALAKHEARLGVSLEEFASSEKARDIALRNLDKERIKGLTKDMNR